jgi:hypothetical protein
MIKYAFFTILLISACSPKADIGMYAEQFSALECKAVYLKDKRYALADRLREIELDSVTHRKELDSLNKLIIVTKEESLTLADSIKYELDNLFKNHLKSPSDRKLFNETLRKIIETKGCNFQ